MRLGTLISVTVCLALVGSARSPDVVTAGRSFILLGAPVLSDRTVSEVSVGVTGLVSMWNPWSDENYPTDLAKTNVVSVRGTPTLFLFCFEDYLPMLGLSSIVLAQPRAIVSVANLWWVRNSDAAAIQSVHVRAWAKLFGIPLVTATNK